MILARALILSTLASVAYGYNTLGLCADQGDCIDFTIKKLETSSCMFGGDCTIEVCLILDTTKDGCSKEGPISHLCGATDANGCAAFEEDGVTPLTGKGTSSDCSLTGLDGSLAFDGKCEPLETQTRIVICQEAMPGQTLYWALKDSGVADMGAYDYTGVFTYDNNGAECSPQIVCTGDSGLECGDPNNSMFEVTRVWKYTIPQKDGSTCDLCAPPPTVPPAPPAEEDAIVDTTADATNDKATTVDDTKNTLALCPAQKDCIDFTIKKADSSACAFTGSCGIEVCMILDTTKQGCQKEGPISHLCAASDSLGCAVYDAAGNPLTGKGVSSDCTLTGEDTMAVFDGKCEPSETQTTIVMCQEGSPGETLYWALKDSDVFDATSYDYTGEFTFENDSTSCSPVIECTGDSGLQCANPKNAMYDSTRVWKYTIPVGGTCDLCGAAVEDTSATGDSSTGDSVLEAPDTPAVDGSEVVEEPTTDLINESGSDVVELEEASPNNEVDQAEPSTQEDLNVDSGMDPNVSNEAEQNVEPANDTEVDQAPTSTQDDVVAPAQDQPIENIISYEVGSRGDPHFKTWKNEHFEFHGQCDLVLVQDPNFADGLGLDVQIRTKLVRYWSYIKSAAIRIGNDILEVQGTVDMTETKPMYWYNFKRQAQVSSVGGFPLENITGKANSRKHHFTIDLSSKYPGVKIAISTMKEFVKVDFINSTPEAFGNTVGMLGEFETGKTLGRDRATEMHVFNELGMEWQIRPSDNMLFHDVSDPQYPKRCVLPEDPQGQRKRRLAESSVSMEDAEKACASLTDELDRKECVYDIIATQDLDMAGAY